MSYPIWVYGLKCGDTVRNLTNEEADIYDNKLNTEAEDTGITLFSRLPQRYKLIKRTKCAKWIPINSYDLFGGDVELWEAHGNPIAEWYCSNCHTEAILDCNDEFCLTRYCGNCGMLMINGGTTLKME